MNRISRFFSERMNGLYAVRGTPLWNLLIFGSCVIGAAGYSLYRGQDANWDLKNYHLYVPFALVNGRADVDVAPAQLQSYSNPGLDLPFYFLATRLNEHPKVIAILMALPAAAAVFFTLLVLTRVFARSRERGAFVLFSMLVGISGAAGISQWGTTTNEWHVAAIDMIALYIIVRALDERSLGIRHIVSAGLLCGIATGLKLTSATACVALCGGLFFLNGTLSNKTRWAATFGFAVLVGLITAAGSWMWSLYRDFGSPLFPYFNGIFQSPWWDPRDIIPRTFGPRTWTQAVLFPFEMLHKNSLSSEPYLRDWHMPLLYVALILTLAKHTWMTLRRFPDIERDAADRRVRFTDIERLLIAYLVFYYLFWLGVHSIYRYLIQLELISGCVFVVLCRRLLPRVQLSPVLFTVLLLLWATKVNPSWGRVDFGSRFFDVQVPSVPANALVLLGSAEPMAYLVPFFPPEARFVGINNNILRPGMSNLLANRARDIVAAHKGDMYVIDHVGREDFSVLGSYGLRVDGVGCRIIASNMDRGGISLCPVVPVRRAQR